MKILVFEWLVGGGIAGEADISSSDPFLVQGAGMYRAILDDCLMLGAEVLSPLDPRRSHAIADFETLRSHDNFHITPITIERDLEPVLRSLAQQADHILLIAPECEGILARCVQWLDGFQSKLVCGPQSLIETFTDKNATQQLLQSEGIFVPTGISLPTAILNDGQGRGLHETIADNVFLCHNLDQLYSACSMLNDSGATLRVERYIAGTPVSVSIVRNENETQLLPGTEQQFSKTWNNQDAEKSKNTNPDPIGHFVKSAYPLEEKLQHRAEALATLVAAALPQWRGYLGVDMVLADDGPDVVVELNPRLTASYETVRAETGFNLMEFLLDVE